MLKQNMEEYKQIREAMESVRVCLRQYISYSLGGAGIIYLSINHVPIDEVKKALTTDKELFAYINLALIYMFSAALISAFFHLSLYKFNSLNRYSGYCKLISLETFVEETVEKPKAPEIPDTEKFYPVKKGNKEFWPEYFVFWEVCVAKLYNAHHNKITDKHYNSLQFKCEGVKEDFDKIIKLKEKFELYKLEKPTSDNNALKSALKLVTPGFNFFKEDPIKSWKYPLYTAGIFYIIILFFCCLTGLNLLQLHKMGIELSWNFDGVLTAKFFVLLLLVLIVFWILGRSLYEIHRLMRGSKTVSAYCWKFIIFRIKVLNSIGIAPTYYFTDRDFID